MRHEMILWLGFFSPHRQDRRAVGHSERHEYTGPAAATQRRQRVVKSREGNCQRPCQALHLQCFTRCGRKSEKRRRAAWRQGSANPGGNARRRQVIGREMRQRRQTNRHRRRRWWRNGHAQRTIQQVQSRCFGAVSTADNQFYRTAGRANQLHRLRQHDG